MGQDDLRKKLTGWNEPLSNLGKRKWREKHPINSDRLARSGAPSSQKQISHPGSPYTESSKAAHPAASSPSHEPTSLANQQAASQAFEPGVNLAIPSFDALTQQSQARYLPMAPFGLPSSASAALTYPHGNRNWSGSPYTEIGVNAGSHNIPQPTLDSPGLLYAPGATRPFFTSTNANTPPDHSQAGLYPRAADHLCVPESLQHSHIDPNAPYVPLGGTFTPPTAPYDVQTPAGASCSTPAPQSAVIDPDPSLYIDSLSGYYLQSKRLPDDDTVRTAYFHDKAERPTILAMRLAHFRHDEYRIATKCVHYRKHTPDGWHVSNQSNDGSLGRDHPSEREKCFMTELAIEGKLPIPTQWKQVWRNSYSLAFSEQLSKIPHPWLRSKATVSRKDLAERAFQLTAGYIEHCLQNTNPGSQIATIGLSKTTEAFDKLSYPALVSVDHSFTRPPTLTQREIAILTRDLPATTPVPNLTVGSVDLNKFGLG
jgi:hypothetical protein